MAEYICLAVVDACSRKFCAEPDGKGGYVHEWGADGYVVRLCGEQRWVAAEEFEDNYLLVDDGTGAALKSVAAMAMVAAISGVPLPGQETDAQKGILNEDHYTGVAALCHDVVRQWRRNKGVSLMSPQWGEASKGQRQVAVQAVQHFVGELPGYPPGVIDVQEAALYKTIISGLLG